MCNAKNAKSHVVQSWWRSRHSPYIGNGRGMFVVGVEGVEGVEDAWGVIC